MKELGPQQGRPPSSTTGRPSKVLRGRTGEEMSTQKRKNFLKLIFADSSE